MFDIGWSEFAVIALVALVVIGPKDLPKVLRAAGKWAGKARGMAREFQSHVDDMMREAEIDEIKNKLEAAERTSVGRLMENTIDPTGDMARTFDIAADDPFGLKGSAAGPTAPSVAPKPDGGAEQNGGEAAGPALLPDTPTRRPGA